MEVIKFIKNGSHLNPSFEDEAIFRLRIDLEKSVDIFTSFVDSVDMKQKDAGII
jgi:hypothetical protein